MATTIPASARQAAVDAVVDLMDAGAGAGLVKIYSGAAPDPDVAATGTLLATLTCTDPAFGAASDDGTTATATASAITDETSATAGTAGYFRAEDSNNACVIQGTVTATGGGGDMELNTVTITAGGTVSVTAWTVTMGQTQT